MIAEQMELDYMDLRSSETPRGTIEDGILTLRVDLGHPVSC